MTISFWRDSRKLFWRCVIFIFPLDFFILRPSSRNTTAELGLWRMRLHGWGSCQCAVLYPAEISRCLHKLTAPERKLLQRIWFFFFSKQSHTNMGLDSSSGKECCYASLNKLVFKQSFLWFTADGGLWLMLPFKTLILLYLSQPSPLFPGQHIISAFYLKWRILDGL